MEVLISLSNFAFELNTISHGRQNRKTKLAFVSTDRIKKVVSLDHF